MRPTLILALLVPVACADSAPDATEYDEIARIVGTGLATPERGGEVNAVADSLVIAKGGMPKGFVRDAYGVYVGERFGLTYRYLVSCGDGIELVACRDIGDTAGVIASWGGELSMFDFHGSLHRTARWRITGLQSAMAMASGTSSLSEQDATFFDDPEQTYRLTGARDLVLFAEMSSGAMMGGSMAGTVGVVIERPERPPVRFDVATEISVDAREIARLTLDHEFEYEVDLSNGAVTPR